MNIEMNYDNMYTQCYQGPGGYTNLIHPIMIDVVKYWFLIGTYQGQGQREAGGYIFQSSITTFLCFILTIDMNHYYSI